MTAPAPAPTPQLYTPDDLAALLSADFSARGIPATVEVGEWDPELHRGEPRVIIGYGRARVGEPAGHYQPGTAWTVPGTTNVARALLDDAQRFAFIVHAPALRERRERTAAAARRATDQLKLSHLRRAPSRPRRAVPRAGRRGGKWPKAPTPSPDGYSGWTYGSRCDFEVVFASPILDDANGVIPVTSVSTDTSILFADGGATQPETNAGATG